MTSALADIEVAHVLFFQMRGVPEVGVTELILGCMEQFDDESEDLERFDVLQQRVHDTIMCWSEEGVIEVDGGLCRMRGDAQ